MQQQRGAGRLLRLTAVILILQGCGSSEESGDTATVLPGEQDYALELSGSVGDGPVIDSTLTVLARDNQVLDSTLSDQLAGYNLQVRTKGKHYPLTIRASGGLDLVTRLPLDFTMLGAATEPRKKAVANVNPFSTLAVAVARQMNGGLSTANLSIARDAVVTEFNLGMTSALSLDPLGTPIGNGNLAEIVKSAEALAEIFRRTATTMQTASFTASIQFVIDAIAADLVDGVLDGRGAGLTNRHVSAITMIVAAQVSMESMRNELTVNGRIATSVLDDVITQLSGGQSAELTDARPVTSYLIERALQGVDAAILLGAPSALDSARTSLMTLRPGASAAAARQALPNGASAMLDGAITQLGGGSTSDIDIVLTGSSVPAPANTAPTISGVPPASVAQDALVNFVPTANDADGDTLTFILTGNPIWLTLNSATGEISGTPRAADVGIHTNIQLSVTDGQATSSLPAFSVSVVGTPPPNNAPVISGTPTTSVLQGTAYQFIPAASDADGDSLTFSIANRPVWATFNTTTGSLSGTPLANDVGSHGNIVISVNDGQAGASLPAFSVAVQALPPPPPPPPPPPGNTAPVISGTPATVVSQNAAYQFVPTSSDADGDTLTFSIVNRPGWAGFNTSTGSLSGTPAAGDVGTYGNIVISVSDGQASASLSAFTLAVQAVNTAPVISGSPTTAVSQNAAYQFVPTASDADGDTLTFSVVNRPGWAGFNTSTGSLSGTPAAGDVGSYGNIVISVSDGQASASLSAFTLVVQAVNTAPVISGTPSTAVSQNAAYQFVPAASDADGDTLTFSIVNRPGWAGFNTSTGSLSGTPAAGDVGTYGNIVVSVSDGQASASLSAFTLVVQAVNTAPVISGTPSTAVSQNAAYQFVPAASDADGDTLTFSIVNRPGWAGFNTSTGSLSGTPAAGDVGSYGNIVISVSDGQASASLSAFTLVVQAVNTAPVISGTPSTAVSQNAAYQFVPAASDADGDTLTFSIVNRPGWAGFNTSTGSLSGTPAAGDVGTYANIVVSVSDGQASASLSAFTLVVQAVNTAPVISGSPTTAVLQDTAYQFAPAASDADGDALSFSIANQPGWATFNSATGVLGGTPTAGDVGTYTAIVISVTDGQSSASLPAFSITVNAVSLGSATLSWQAPTTYEDGSPLSDLAGYRIYWGQASGSYPNDVIVMNPGLVSFVVDNLTRGTTYYFAVKALNSNDVESAFSNEASKLIP